MTYNFIKSNKNQSFTLSSENKFLEKPQGVLNWSPPAVWGLNTKIGEFKNPDVSKLVTNCVSNTKIGEVKNKIPDHELYITTPEFNKLT